MDDQQQECCNDVDVLRDVRLADAITHLGDADEVFVRLALSLDDRDHRILRCLVVDVLPQAWLRMADDPLAALWRQDQRLFESQQAFFFCGLLKSEIVQDWFRRPDNCGITAFDNGMGQASRRVRFVLPEFHDNLSAWRLASYEEAGVKAIPYPSTLYELAPKPLLSSQQPPQFRDDDKLVSADGTYFRSFRSARAELIFGVTNHNVAYQRNDMIAIRVVDARGWLKEIRVLPDKAVMTLGGTSILRGGYVVVEGDALRNKQQVFNHHVVLPLPSELPQEIQVVLLGGHEVLDSAYFYNTRHPYAGIALPNARNSPQVIVEREDVVGYEAPTITVAPAQTPAEVLAAEDAEQSHPKAFVSYSHDSPEHKEKVRNLVVRLRADGVACVLDRYEQNPSKGWQKWMEAKIAWADYVLVVCTETYCRRFNGQEAPGKGLGAAWEGMIITQALYDQAGDNDKFIPVVFSPEDAHHIPVSLQATTRYLVSDEVEYEKLYARLTGQVFEELPPLGNIRPVRRKAE